MAAIVMGGNLNFTKLSDGTCLVTKYANQPGDSRGWKSSSAQILFQGLLSAADITALNTELGAGGIAPPAGAGEALGASTLARDPQIT
jgi:hypothetical protein